MSRIVLHDGKRFTIVIGADHVLKSFIQLYDKTKENETPEGEGLIFDWSVTFGVKVNKTNINLELSRGTILYNIKKYIKSQSPIEGKYIDLVI